MRAWSLFSTAFGLLGLHGAAGCGATEEGMPEGGTGGAPGEALCASDQEITIVPGKGVGALFMPYQEGDAIVPYFGSQIGMEVALSVRLTGFRPTDIDSIEVHLNVDGAPIGFDSFSPSELSCDGNEPGTIETPVLIDVTGHPTVRSVAQLSGRDAEIEVQIEGEGGPFEARLPVVIEL